MKSAFGTESDPILYAELPRRQVVRPPRYRYDPELPNPLDAISWEASRMLGRQVVAFIGTPDDLTPEMAEINRSIGVGTPQVPRHPDEILAILVQDAQARLSA